ncbi:MAG: phosphoglycerate kinase [Holosporaceae bacterium]|jgi:phosphoglycerate kinase|nr:phosphoglycerate kinase [Holosporaceae bacterium]
MGDYKVIKKSDLEGKKVLVRVDFNVPLEDGVVQDRARIKNAAGTVQFLREARAKIILASHLGKTSLFNPDQSLEVVRSDVADEYKAKVVLMGDYLSENASATISQTSPDEIILLENLRFHTEEESCNMEFAKKLAGLADFYINEAFSVSHRRHASIFAVPQFLPHALGLSFKNEVQIVEDFFSDASFPKMCLIGGSKLSTKVKLLKNLVKRVHKLALGGGIAGAFLSFLGNKTLKIFDPKEYESDVAEIIENARQCGCELIMPIDFSALINDRDSFRHAIISCEKDEASVFDIGPASVDLFKKNIGESKMLLWNGPVGLFERAPFNFGTMSIAKEVAQLTREKRLISIVGGGDTGFAMSKFGVAQDLSHISTAGGAFLSYIEGSELPGVEAMKDACVLG